jgi:protein AroM
MANILIGALTIGQSPRPDLVAPLRQVLPNGCEVREAGALDALSKVDIPLTTRGAYPLTTQLQDGSLVMVEESFLLPRLQHALTQLEAAGVVATILLCAGTFAGLQATRPFVKPFSITRQVLQTLGLKSLGLIAPIPQQAAPIRQRWQAAGFVPSVWTADLDQQDKSFQEQLTTQIAAHSLECIVLDYVGHPAARVRQLQEASPLPVIDLGQLAMRALAATL